MASKSVNIDDEVFAKAQSKASNDFDGSWSNYLNYLVKKDVDMEAEK